MNIKLLEINFWLLVIYLFSFIIMFSLQEYFDDFPDDIVVFYWLKLQLTDGTQEASPSVQVELLDVLLHGRIH